MILRRGAFLLFDDELIKIIILKTPEKGNFATVIG